jgi:hypothetical protein
MNKRVTIILLAAALSATPALADPVSDFISNHNSNSIISGASEINVSPTIQNGKYFYDLQKDIDIIVSEDNGEIKSFSCVCYDDSGVGEFLAQCVTAFYDIGGMDSYINCHGELLSEYLSARAGKETKSNSSVPGVLFQVSKTDNPSRYIFIIVKVK